VLEGLFLCLSQLKLMRSLFQALSSSTSWLKQNSQPQQQQNQGHPCQFCQIEQIRVAPYLNAFKQGLLSNTKLVDYSNENAPSFFYGLGSGLGLAQAYEDSLDIRALKRHNSLAVIIWTGGDANDQLWGSQVIKTFAWVRSQPHIFSISISDFIARSLDRHGVRHLRFPFYPLNYSLFAPVPNGDAVYFYGPTNHYGLEYVVKNVAPHISDIPIIYARHKAHAHLPKTYLNVSFHVFDTAEALITHAYKRAFIGLRLTTHDGLAASVQEMGLMGRRTIWNGGTPSAIPWTNWMDIVASIRSEQALVQQTNLAVARAVQDFLRVPPSFYQLASYFQLNCSCPSLERALQ